MSHPYSGPASYIYANEHLADDDDEIYGTRGTSRYPLPLPASVLSSPPTSPQSESKSWSPIFDRAFSSVPQFSFTTDFRGERYKQFSRSSQHVAVANSNRDTADFEPYIYESMRVRFDTPNEHVLLWRRKLKFIKRKLGRFTRGVTKMVTHNWITTPRPRLSMIE